MCFNAELSCSYVPSTQEDRAVFFWTEPVLVFVLRHPWEELRILIVACSFVVWGPWVCVLGVSNFGDPQSEVGYNKCPFCFSQLKKGCQLKQSHMLQHGKLRSFRCPRVLLPRALLALLWEEQGQGSRRRMAQFWDRFERTNLFAGILATSWV